MDVRRMMNLFILLFALINVILFFLNQQIGAVSYFLPTEANELMIEVLEGEAIEVEFDQNVTYAPRARLIIRGADFSRDEQAIRSKMLHGEMKNPQYGDDATSHVYETLDGNERLTFNRGAEAGEIYYAAIEPYYIPETYTPAAYGSLAQSFVEDLTLGEGSFELTDSQKGEDFTLYYFHERYQGELLFCNEVVVKIVEEKGITEARAIRYKPYEPNAFEGDLLALRPLDQAMYQFMYHFRSLTEEAVTIEHVSIGYYLGPDDRNDLISLAIEPHYQIRLSTGETYYINAYTNNIVE